MEVRKIKLELRTNPIRDHPIKPIDHVLVATKAGVYRGLDASNGAMC
jgi:hypothetical protein